MQSQPKKVLRLVDPTHSGFLRNQMVSLLKQIMWGVRRGVEIALFGILNSQNIVTFSRPAKRIVALSAESEKKMDEAIKLTSDPSVRAAIKRAVRVAYDFGERQAARASGRALGTPVVTIPPKPTTTPLRYKGMFVSSAIIRELANTNVSLVKTVATKFVTHLRLLVAKTVGTGGMTVDDLRSAIRKRFKVSNNEAAGIARTEVIRTINNGKVRNYLKMGFVYGQWQAALEGGTCDFCNDLHGKIVKIGTPFGKFRGKDSINVPPAHTNCRCTILPAFGPTPTIPIVKKRRK